MGDFVYDFKVASIDEIHDGDTMTLTVDQGFGNKKTFDCRLVGYDACEMKDAPKGTQARDAVRKSMTEMMAADGFQYLVATTEREKDGDDKQSFARYLATITAVFKNGNVVPVNKTLAFMLAEKGLLKPGSKWNTLTEPKAPQPKRSG